jgi:hypothetical protein
MNFFIGLPMNRGYRDVLSDWDFHPGTSTLFCDQIDSAYPGS